MVELVAARGVDLAVEEIGDVGPALVWAHGLTSSREGEDQRRWFAWPAGTSAGWRMVRYDARGHGASGGTTEPDTYRWERLGGDMLTVADAVGLDTFVAGGASMGCATALEAALAAPDRVERLVLVIPPTAWATRAAQGELYRQRADLLEAEGLEAWSTAMAAVPRPAIFADETEEPYATWVSEALLPSVLRGAAASDLPSPERLATIDQPALILAWETDPAHPVSTAVALAGILPASELHVASTLAGVRRWPDLVAAAVR